MAGGGLARRGWTLGARPVAQAPKSGVKITRPTVNLVIVLLEGIVLGLLFRDGFFPADPPAQGDEELAKGQEDFDEDAHCLFGTSQVSAPVMTPTIAA